MSGTVPAGRAAPRLHVGGTAALDLTLSVARLPGPGETVSGELLARGPGGKALNYALAARRLGAVVALLTSLGQDQAGDELLAALQAAGVETWGVQRVPGLPSALSVIAVEPGGENQILTVLGAASVYTLSTPPAGAVPAALILQAEWPLDVLMASITPSGPPAVLNLAPYRELPGELLARCDTLIFNEQEAALFGLEWPVPERSVSAERWVHSLRRRVGPHPVVIVTLGARGALIVEGDHVQQVPALPVDVRDTSGAGDSFVATYAVQRTSGLPVLTCVCTALAAASLTVQRRGTAESFPTWAEVEDQLARFRPATWSEGPRTGS